jgi:hypothetical protein
LIECIKQLMLVFHDCANTWVNFEVLKMFFLF